MKGTLKEVRDGVWRLRVVDRYDAKGNPHQLSKTVRGTKRQAETQLAAFVTQVENGQAPTSGSVTFGDYLQQSWLPHVKAIREPTTYQAHAGRVAQILPFLGHVKLAKLTTLILCAAYDQWPPSSVKARSETIGAALEQAVRWQLIPRNVSKLADRPNVPKRQPTMPTVDEIHRIVELARQKDPIMAMLIQLASGTGMRRGELCGLRWRDLDIEHSVLRVQSAVKHVTGRTYVAETKTHRARRFAIDAGTVELLQVHRALMASVGKGADDDFVFNWSQAHDQPTNPNRVTMRFGDLARNAGVSCRFHDIRHFTASNLLANNVPVPLAAKRLGFTPRVLFNTYAHVVEDDADRAAAGIMGNLLASTNTSQLTV